MGEIEIKPSGQRMVIIGAGSAGHAALRLFNQTQGLVVGIADPDPQAIGFQLARELQAPIFADAVDAISPEAAALGATLIPSRVARLMMQVVEHKAEGVRSHVMEKITEVEDEIADGTHEMEAIHADILSMSVKINSISEFVR